MESVTSGRLTRNSRPDMYPESTNRIETAAGQEADHEDKYTDGGSGMSKSNGRERGKSMEPKKDTEDAA